MHSTCSTEQKPYCTALHCTALHCPELHCIALKCTALPCTALNCTALHCTAAILPCTALQCFALHYTVSSTAQHYTKMHKGLFLPPSIVSFIQWGFTKRYTLLHYTPLHVWYCTISILSDNWIYAWHKKCDRWHVPHDTGHETCDRWQVIYDRWNIKQDTWYMPLRGWWTFYQNIRSLALTVWK